MVDAISAVEKARLIKYLIVSARGGVGLRGDEVLTMKPHLFLFFFASQTRNIQRLNEFEIKKGLSESGSWHDQYKDSPYIFIGGLPFDLNEGDISSVFAQYGVIEEVYLVREKETGKSRGFAFLGYKDQRSTILAVDNLNGIKLLGRTIRVDHAANYISQKEIEAEKAAKARGQETVIAEMADEIFKTAVGGLFSIPKDYDEVATMMSPKSDAGQETEDDQQRREERRRLKEERRMRETSAERRARKHRRQ